jgi:DNA-binding XRE family transcriptional regulator
MAPSTIRALKLAKALPVTVEELFSIETIPN